MKVHHAVLDGAAGIALADALLDRTPVPRAVPRPPRGRRAPPTAPGFAALAGAALRHDVAQYAKLVRHLPDLVTAVAGIVRGPRTPGSRTPATWPRLRPQDSAQRGRSPGSARSPPCRFRSTRRRAVARAFDAKLNDVVLAICSGALRSYLSGHGGIPEEPLVAGMPFSLREAGDTEYSTQATMTLVSLATDIADPVERLLAIRDARRGGQVAARRAPVDHSRPTLRRWARRGCSAGWRLSTAARSLPTRSRRS